MHTDFKPRSASESNKLFLKTAEYFTKMDLQFKIRLWDLTKKNPWITFLRAIS